jgi:hypothetical protein
MDFDAFLQTLYDLPVSQDIRTDYLWFPLAESIHVVAICLVVGSVFIVDLRLLGITSHKKPVTELAREVLPWTWGAFAVALVAGGFMFISKAPTYWADDYFRYKMAFMALAGINMAIFHVFTYRSVRNWDSDVPTVLAAKIAGGLSCLFWIAVVACGRWSGFTIT